LDTFDSVDSLRRGDDEEVAAGGAFVVGVDAVVGLLLPDELEGLMSAWGQLLWPRAGGFYAFGLGGRGGTA
jgi:hypothetical protein